MSIDEISLEALKLPPQQRALLAAALWGSIEDPYALAVGMTDAEALALAAKRDAEMDAGQVAPIDHDTLMRRLRK